MRLHPPQLGAEATKRDYIATMATTLDITGLSLLTRATALGGGDFISVLSDLDIQAGKDEYAFQKLSIEQLSALLNALANQCTQKHFPFAFGEIFNFDGLPELSAFITSSSNFHEAAKLVDWVPKLIHSAIQIDGSQIRQNATTTLGFCYPDGSEASIPVFAEMIAAVVKRFANVIAPDIQPLQEIRFAHAPLRDPSDYEDYFACPVRFDCDRNQIQFKAETLDQPLPGNFPPAHEQAEQSIRVKLLDSERSTGLRGQIQALLKKDLALFSQGIEGVANALHTHPRKLQRQLKAEGHSFSALLAETRKAIACDMLKNSDLDIDSIGFKLGFEERRSFTSAFKKWLGETPTAYRQRLKQN